MKILQCTFLMPIAVGMVVFGSNILQCTFFNVSLNFAAHAFYLFEQLIYPLPACNLPFLP